MGRLGTWCCALMAAVGLVVVPAPTAQAAPGLWSVQSVEHIATMPGSGATAGFQVACPSGQTPIAGSYHAYGSSNVQRLVEEVGYGSGQSYSVTLRSGPNNGADELHVTAYCVPTSYFSDSVVKYGVFTANSGGVAAGTVNCDPGWYSLSSRVTFGSFSGGPIRTSTPDQEFDAWYAVGTAPAGTTMTVIIRCVPAGDLGNVRFVSTAVAIGGAEAPASASCPVGLMPIVGGTYQESGSPAVTVMARPYEPTRSWVSRALGGTGSMRTNVVCVPSGLPATIVNSGVPTPQPNSSAASWSFSASDPAAAGGYGVSTSCSLDSDGWFGCSSPYVSGVLSDGNHTLDVRATTSDGRTGASARGTVRIDTTAPAWTVTSPEVFATATPAITLAVDDNDPYVGFQCAVDGATPANCGGSQIYTHPTTHTLYLSGSFADGPHTIQVTGTDGRGNTHAESLSFTVDTGAPLAALTGTAKPFVLTTSVPVAWSAGDATTSIAGSTVRWRRAPYNGAFSAPADLATTAAVRSTTLGPAARGSTTCWSVQSRDAAGNPSPWTSERCSAVPLDDRDLARSSGWHTATVSGWFRGTSLRTTTAGARLAVTGATVRQVAVVARRCRTCGKVAVIVAGVRIATIDLAASSSSRQLIVLPRLSSTRAGGVAVKVLTSGKLVEVDAVGISQR